MIRLLAASAFTILLLAGCSNAPTHPAHPTAVDKSPIKLQMKRGMAAADECSADHMLDAAKISLCALDAQDKNKELYSNHAYYDLGLFFESWIHEDLIYRASTSLSDSGDIIAGLSKTTKKQTA